MDVNRISGCTYPVREKSLDYTFKLFANAGFRKIDLWGGLPNFSTDPSKCDPVRLRDKASEYGIMIANLGTYCGRGYLTGDPDEELTELKRTIDIAVILGSRSIRVHPGGGEDPNVVDKLVPFFSEGAEYAERNGVYMGMENHKGSIAGIPDVMADLVRKVGSKYFGVLYEPSNLMHCKVNYKEAYEIFKGMITHVHVKDSRWRNGEFERTMLGDGDVDYRWIVSRLISDGYDGDFALEYEIEKIIPIEEGLPKWFEVFSRA